MRCCRRHLIYDIYIIILPVWLCSFLPKLGGPSCPPTHLYPHLAPLIKIPRHLREPRALHLLAVGGQERDLLIRELGFDLLDVSFLRGDPPAAVVTTAGGHDVVYDDGVDGDPMGLDGSDQPLALHHRRLLRDGDDGYGGDLGVDEGVSHRLGLCSEAADLLDDGVAEARLQHVEDPRPPRLHPQKAGDDPGRHLGELQEREDEGGGGGVDDDDLVISFHVNVVEPVHEDQLPDAGEDPEVRRPDLKLKHLE